MRVVAVVPIRVEPNREDAAQMTNAVGNWFVEPILIINVAEVLQPPKNAVMRKVPVIN